MRVIFRNCGFVRFPVFGTISGPHLECVQRILFVLCHSNFLVQALSNGRFWLQESDFGLNKWCQACFWRKLPPKPESSIQLKSFIFWTVVDRDQSETSHFSKFAEGNSWKLAHFAVKTRGPRSSSRGSCLILTAPVNISNGKNAATEFPFETFCLPCFSHFSMVGGPANIILRTPLSELVCISQEKECRNYFRRRQKVTKKNPKESFKYVMQVILKNCGFVRLPVFGIISGPHLECVQRLLFVLFRSNVFVQAVSSGRFWLKESNFGPGKWCQACFW